MWHEEFERREKEAAARIHAAVMTEFCDVLGKSELPPMVVMRLLARSVGAAYREVADAHMPPSTCPCGWRPNERSDSDVLSAALKLACQERRSSDLGTMHVAGRA